MAWKNNSDGFQPSDKTIEAIETAVIDGKVFLEKQDVQTKKELKQLFGQYGRPKIVVWDSATKTNKETSKAGYTLAAMNKRNQKAVDEVKKQMLNAIDSDLIDLSINALKREDIVTVEMLEMFDISRDDASLIYGVEPLMFTVDPIANVTRFGWSANNKNRYQSQLIARIKEMAT
jgi:hypothetical protein